MTSIRRFVLQAGLTALLSPRTCGAQSDAIIDRYALELRMMQKRVQAEELLP